MIFPFLLSLVLAHTPHHRSAAVRREFQRDFPCPSTSSTHGACPGYIADHKIPLSCGGADAITNMQWQTTAAARIKDRWERFGCGDGKLILVMPMDY